MNEKTMKCPMCGLPKGEDCDLMISKGGEKTLYCCCETLQKKSVKKQCQGIKSNTEPPEINFWTS